MKTNEIISSLRKGRNITQEELSARLNINRSVLNRIEKGSRPIRNNELKSFADYFGVSTDFLLGYGESKNSQNKLTQDETQLLDMFRRLSSEGKRALIAMVGQMKPAPTMIGV